jgi:hypothetical protein
MTRALARYVPILAVAVFAATHGVSGAGASSVATPPILQRFLALGDPTPTSYRARRHMEARNDKLDMSAWMDVWTEADAAGFRYRIVAEEGADSIRTRVFRDMLEKERKMWAAGADAAAALTPDNYLFEDRGAHDEGLTTLTIRPRRKDTLLVDGALFVRPDGELLRMEGDVAKPPSFWTRRVRIVRRFERLAGIRMPVSLDAVATMRLFGESSFHAVYEYETVNAAQIGIPQLRAAR